MNNDGYEFIDMGTDGATNRSPFYAAEKKRLDSIGATAHKAPSKRVKAERGFASESDRPAAKSWKACKKQDWYKNGEN